MYSNRQSTLFLATIAVLLGLFVNVFCAPVASKSNKASLSAASSRSPLPSDLHKNDMVKRFNFNFMRTWQPLTIYEPVPVSRLNVQQEDDQIQELANNEEEQKRDDQRRTFNAGCCAWQPWPTFSLQ
uniref:Transmembrane protein n=1 Tax=Ditylenchus dipsaci TaxID=166011 RepID=A0A915EQZ6_9BILA